MIPNAPLKVSWRVQRLVLLALSSLQSDSAFYGKAQVYAKTEVYARTESYNKSETYNRTELQAYVSAAVYAAVVCILLFPAWLDCSRTPYNADVSVELKARFPAV